LVAAEFCSVITTSVTFGDEHLPVGMLGCVLIGLRTDEDGSSSNLRLARHPFS
jgi:hypothetical protein